MDVDYWEEVLRLLNVELSKCVLQKEQQRLMEGRNIEVRIRIRIRISLIDLEIIQYFFTLCLLSLYFYISILISAFIYGQKQRQEAIRRQKAQAQEQEHFILPDWPVITEKEAEDGVYSPPPLQRGDLAELKEGVRRDYYDHDQGEGPLSELKEGVAIDGDYHL